MLRGWNAHCPPRNSRWRCTSRSPGVVLPPIEEAKWREVQRAAYPRSAVDEYPFVIRVLERRGG
jgi:hypothetical protein